ncbi:MAG: hypothetical protein HC857_01780 [Synechococcales cyanobacterium RU_4_20]|nr:hypothetical protein [Synechococcales cyanobacterium RU_4_20]
MQSLALLPFLPLPTGCHHPFPTPPMEPALAPLAASSSVALSLGLPGLNPADFEGLGVGIVSREPDAWIGLAVPALLPVLPAPTTQGLALNGLIFQLLPSGDAALDDLPLIDVLPPIDVLPGRDIFQESDALLLIGDLPLIDVLPGRDALPEGVLLEGSMLAALQPALTGSLAGSQFQPTAVFQSQGAVERLELSDRFQFSIPQSGVFTANLSSLSADADLRLIQDKNRNGQVDAGEILAWQWERGTQSESIRRFVDAGEYFVQVVNQTETAATYQLQTDFAPAAADPLKFSLAVSKRTGLEPLTPESLAAVERAAKYWENVITHSSFAAAQTLSVGLYGTQNPSDTFLAYAGPQSYRKTGGDRLLPASGVAVINMAYANQYNANPGYLELVMRHEFAHALGFGVAWERSGNALVSQGGATYRSDTYAGRAYGDLLGLSQGVAIPIDNERAHWQEAALDAELMTPRAESLGTATPLSQMSIASLRDLGWNVNYGAAEPFALGPSQLAQSSLARTRQPVVIV